ncbi:MAG: NYN domain-containing protein [Phycisphaerae bacterium]|nr:NYN domain-containing protein [Phycisphaerae bacterium]
MPYIFDAYNLYHVARNNMEESAEITPAMLCVMIAWDMRYIKDKAIICFDSVLPRGWPKKIEPEGFIEIRCSGHGYDADSLIEDLIEANSAPKRLTIISSDRRIRKAARARKCKSITSHDYLPEMLKRLAKIGTKPREPREKYTGVPDGQLGPWLDMFGIKKQLPEDPDGLDELMGRISN